MRLTSKWQLVACGLVAHADDVLDGEECDRLMAMVDEEVDGDEYSSWLTAVGDRERLRAIMSELPPPPADSHRAILEQAWNMSIVDGERCEAESAVLEELAARLGVEPMQLEFWRDAWAAAEHDAAQWIAAALGWVLGGGKACAPEDGTRIRLVVTTLPTADAHREALVGVASDAQSRDDVIRRLSKLSRRKRRWALSRMAPAVSSTDDGGDAQRRYIELAAELGIAASTADALLRA
jgi:tellurite resistance protein